MSSIQGPLRSGNSSAGNVSPWIASVHRIAAAQTLENLSVYLHRLPTPPPYLRPMRLSVGRGAGIRWVIRLPPGRGWSSSKSPSTDEKVNYLVIRCLYFISVRGGLDLSSSSTSVKVNRLVIRYLHFWSVLGDLQEGHGCSSRCQFPLFRAQNRGFCALLAFGTLVFGHFEHKIGVFVRFCPSGPQFLALPSTKLGFLCSGCR